MKFCKNSAKIANFGHFYGKPYDALSLQHWVKAQGVHSLKSSDLPLKSYL